MHAQTYPSRPIHLIVNFPPGGAGDILGRIIGNQLAIEFKQSVVVENRSGAGGTIGARDVVNAAPDGYTLAVGQTPEMAINPYFMKNVGYETLKDLQPIALAGVMPLALVVPPPSPYAKAEQWVAAFRAKTPMNFASAGVGTPSHLAGELFIMMTGVELVQVHYRTSYVPDMLSGQVQVVFSPVPTTIQQVRAGKLRALAVTTAMRSETLPDIPTIAEFAPGYEASAWFGVGAPRNTPTEVVDKLNTEINASLADPKLKARLLDLGGSALTGSPADF